jgi:hypothetical protein
MCFLNCNYIGVLSLLQIGRPEAEVSSGKEPTEIVEMLG